LEAVKCVVFMLVIVKVFKVLRFNRMFRVFLEGFRIASDSIISETIIMLVGFLAFACGAYFLIGRNVVEYRNFGFTMLALFNLALGKSTYKKHYVVGIVKI
jgi:hypothetical protein